MTTPKLPARAGRIGTLVYGEPLVVEDGVTVMPVSRVRGSVAVPVGVFVVKDGAATWTPAVDANRIAHIGVWTGFAAATIACLAVLRRPPWPRTTITITKNR
ncbi:MAG TPA: hypothetical protein VFE07_06290 [Marmoricola sp.]|nr:hypothetical protein [Marmoricola sp.]